ncbi:MAG: cell division protein FtsW [Actinomycetota bacterium]
MTIAMKRDTDIARRRAAARDAARRRSTSSAPVARRHTGPKRTSLAELVRTDHLGPPSRSYYAIATLTAMLVMLGLAMLLSVSAPARAGGDGSPYTMVLRQAMWAGVGTLGLLVATVIDYRWWRRVTGPLVIFGLGLMLLPFVPGVGRTVNDARSWVQIGPIGFQPSEILKVVLVLVTASLLVRHQDHLGDWRRSTAPLMVMAVAASLLALGPGDFGGAVVLAAIVVAMAFLAGVPLRHLGVSVLGGGLGLLAVLVASPRRFSRLTAFFDLEGNKEDRAYQVWQGLLSIANGGLTGSGIGGSRSKLGYLPLAHSDFVFAIIADELGFVGVIAVLGAFTALVWLGVSVALQCTDPFGMYIAGGIAAWFGIQTVINVGGVVGVLPVTGLTLPFFSQGGTSLSVSLVAIGLLLNVARRGVAPGR